MQQIEVTGSPGTGGSSLIHPFPSPPHPHFHHPSSTAGLISTATAAPPVSVLTKMRKVNVSFTATFSGISGFPSEIGNFTSSPIVELEERLWSVRIYPGGKDEEHSTHIACYVALESRGRVRASYRLSLINQMGWKNHSITSDSVKYFCKEPTVNGVGEPFHTPRGTPLISPTQTNSHPAEMSNCWGESKFISRSDLRHASSGHCVDDTIVVQVELSIYSDVQQSIISSPARVLNTAEKPRTILDDLQSMLYDPATSDINIVTYDRIQSQGTSSKKSSTPDSKSTTSASASIATTFSSAFPFDDESEEHIGCNRILIPAHKFMLTLRSEVFRTMFTMPMAETLTQEIVISDFPSDVIREFLCFLYTDNLTLETLQIYAEELLALSRKYQVMGLQAKCEACLSSRLTVANVATVLQLADLYEAEGLKTRALLFISQNAKAVVSNEAFFDGLSRQLCAEVVKAIAGVSI